MGKTITPKLEFIKIKLNPRGANKNCTLRDVLTAKYDITKAENSDARSIDEFLLGCFFQDILKTIEAPEASVDNAKNIAISSCQDDRIVYLKGEAKMYGKIHGGNIGTKKIAVQAKDTKSTEDLVGKIVMDYYYFVLYTPIDSDELILLVYSLPNLSVADALCKLIAYFLKTPISNLPKRIRFVPDYLQKLVKDKSLVQSFNYESVLEGANLFEKERFATQVKITINTGAKVPISKLSFFDDKIRKNKKLEKLSLKNGKVVLIEKSTRRSTTMEIGPGMTIAPAVYLDELKFSVLEAQPKWEAVKSVIFGHLQKIIQP